MPRSNRPRGRRRPEEHENGNLNHVLFGSRHTEIKRDGSWNVQPVSPTSAVKNYTCPGCSQTITQGTAHTVTWRADGIMGEADDLAARRHWHQHCWKIRL